MPNYLEQRGSY